MSEELAELKKISKLMTLVNAEVLEKTLSKYVTTNERKKAWILIDGKRTTEEIGQLAGMKLRTIQDFLKILTDASLIETSRPPKRIVDYVPASWLDLSQNEAEEKKQ
jgi:transcription initiation factor IIE alpha subunit